MSIENPFATNNQYSCFNCDSDGDGYYKPHEEPTDWYLGIWPLDAQAYYACEDCASALVDPMLISVQGIERDDLVQWIGDPVHVGPDGCHLAIDTGEFRRVTAIDNNKRLWLTGRNNEGMFGSVDPSNVTKWETGK